MHRRRSLLWQVFWVNAGVLVAFGALLLLTPVTVSSSVVLAEALVVVVSLGALLLANLMLLRRVLRPMRELSELMEAVDPLHPGPRLEEISGQSAELTALASAFNHMSNRLASERRASTRRALAAQEAERRRVALELHDQVGQSLTAAAIDAERAGAHDVARELRSTLDDVRRIARELRPEALDDLGLANALIALGRRVGTRSGVRVRTALGEDLPPLSKETELVIYRIAQEGLTNAIRHADADTIELELNADGDLLALVVRDDGLGLPDVLPDGAAGLAGMDERAMLIDGTLLVRRRVEGGTEVRLEVPV